MMDRFCPAPDLLRGRGRLALWRQQEGDECLHVLSLELRRLHASLQHVRPRRVQQRRQLRRREALAEVGEGEEAAAAVPLRAMAARAPLALEQQGALGGVRAEL